MMIGKDEKLSRRVESYVTSRPEKFGYCSEKYLSLVMFICLHGLAFTDSFISNDGIHPTHFLYGISMEWAALHRISEINSVFGNKYLDQIKDEGSIKEF